MTYQNPNQYPQQSGGPGPAAGSEERSMMLLAHLAAPIAYLISAGWIPFIGPLVIWLLYKDKSPNVREVAAGAFNFNVSVTIASWAIWLSIILTFGVGFLWGGPLLLILFVLQIWVVVRGVMKVSEGVAYRYPFQLPILS